MARTIAQIQASIVAARQADPVIGDSGTNPLNSSSNVAIWLLWTWIVATCQWITESLYDAHVAEVQSIIATQTPHTLQWYATMAKAFQFGDALPADSDVYSPVASPGDPTLIVSFAAAVEVNGFVRVKVATGAVGSLSALSGSQLTAFSAYMSLIKDAGVKLSLTSGAGDTFQPAMVIYYDPLQLNSSGQRLDGTENTPVQDAVNLFLNSIPFNGRFILNSFIAAMQAVPGVIIADEVSCQAFYGMTSPVTIATYYVPDAGYLLLDGGYFGSNVSYVAYS